MTIKIKPPSKSWEDTIRDLAFQHTIGDKLLIAPTGSAESASMKMRFNYLLDFVDAVIEAYEIPEQCMIVGCNSAASCGFPNDEHGYLHTCGKHYEEYREGSKP